ncbi:AAA family ATPase [Geopsychrobacter electrodiphilus]|uniref:AAA family ATPase n=1 Tax=Geopsychrobacter electrodiphilus TaxID=225196 RepID=UPI00036DF770|nr:AAA family ATPase [Geopsychrobacter electrodiphilus]
MSTATTEIKIKQKSSFDNELNLNQQSDIRERLKQLLSQIGAGLHEREQILAIALLGTICGQNTFLFGPPGTAKSLISRRLARAFKSPVYFEYLMNRFSTPEEVFGPVSIKALKEDKYLRQVEGYLPTANFAFLDEIWKSSPAILNTLLTLINEHVFKNGNDIIDVPLKALIAASNETPAENQGLDALYDRFILRLLVPPIKNEDRFNALLNSKPSLSKLHVDVNLTIDYQELSTWQQQLHNVAISDDSLLIIKFIRTTLAERFDELGVYVSDRRWQRAAMLLKASAFCNGRTETNHSDAILLKHCLWTSQIHLQEVSDIVMQAVEECGFVTDANLSELDKKKESLDKEINRELFFNEDVYDTVKLGCNKKYFKETFTFKSKSYARDTERFEIFMQYSEFKAKKEFTPVDVNGNENEEIICKFDEQGSCIVSYVNNYNKYENIIFTPKVMFHKGDKKEEINTRLVKSLAGSVIKLRGELKKTLYLTEKKLQGYKIHLESLFAVERETDVAVKGIQSQIGQLKLRIKDCERLEALCR